MASTPTPCTGTFPLNNGYAMPAVGLGTWQGQPGTKDEEAMIKSLVHAIHSGYRLFDTAQIYGVESVVGKAIRESGVPREEITIVTKFWGIWHHSPIEALKISLQALQMDYVDVFLMHWPFANTPDWQPLRIDQSPTFSETWKLMEKLVGPQCRSIGVANFTQKTLDTLLQTAEIVPAVNQVELHAFHPCLNLVPYCESKGIHVMAWGTLGGGETSPMSEILTHNVFTDIAKKHGCSAGVLSLSWVVQRGITVIPKTKSDARILENIRLVTLTDEEMEVMNSAHTNIRQYRSADKNPRMEVIIDGKKTIQGWTAEDFGWEDKEGNWLV